MEFKLTVNHKLLVREAQLGVAKAQINFIQAQQASRSANEVLGQVVDAIAKELGVNETQLAFDVDTLEFVPLKPKE